MGGGTYTVSRPFPTDFRFSGSARPDGKADHDLYVTSLALRPAESFFAIC